MTVPLVTALQAAETLRTFHLEQVVGGGVETGEHHFDMAQRCEEDAEDITNAILANSVTAEHQAEIVRRRDLEIAQRIIDRHVIMHGVGMAADKVPAARMAMARDIANALQVARGGVES
jgi:hypothetical protein